MTSESPEKANSELFVEDVGGTDGGETAGAGSGVGVGEGVGAGTSGAAGEELGGGGD